MLFGEYNFKGVLEDDAVLPPFKGSTFRGVFGRALKEVTCALKRQECPTCLLRHQCVYTQVFDFPLDLQPQGAPSPPHPFVIEPPLNLRTNLPRGEQFDFVLLLFGAANQFLPYFVYAFEEMGKIGIGRKINGQRARYNLHSVTSAADGVIYRSQDKSLAPINPQHLTLDSSEFYQSGGSVNEFTLSLLTPLRLKFQNRLLSELPFHVLMRSVLRRIALLFNFYGNGEPSLDYRGLVERAHEVQVVTSALQWLDWRRYSFLKEESMFLGGLIGSITYRGPLSEFMPLLRLAEKVHVGKNSAFGLGRIKLS